ncbi:MAG: putative Ig domain-containing protein [Planctomycetes bacterium]|nr:putative Ig domain-containing protein [Planctomycetota bacterium]
MSMLKNIRLGRWTLALMALAVWGVVVSGSGSSTNFELDQESTPAVAQDAWSPSYRMIGTLPGSPGGDIGISAQYRMHFDDQTPTSFLPDDLIPPVITGGPTVTYISSTIALVEWTTDEPSNGFVNFGLTPAFGTTASHAGYATLHQVLITTGLAPATFYFYQAQSTDPYANGPTSSGLLDFTTTATPDTAAPVVTPTVTILGTTSAQVDFAIDEMSQTTLNHGPTASMGFVETDPIWRITRTRTFTGLAPGADYFYALDATDPSGNALIGTATPISLPADVTITTTTLPNGRVKEAYLQTIAASNGFGTLTFTVSGGTLPDGLALASDGTLSGTPTASGLYTFTIQADDSGTPVSTATQAFQLFIDKAKKKKDEGCSTGEGTTGWMMFAGLLALLALALRRMPLRRAH